MPRASEAPTERQQVKLLLIGDGKGGKTFYAGLAAADGYNVLLLDGDVASPTIMQKDFPAELREHIYILPVGDKSHPQLSPDFIKFMVRFTTESKLIWDDTNAVLAEKRDVLDESEVWEISPALLDTNWVLVIDSWTSLTQSCMLWAAREHGVDLSNTSAPQMRDVYSSAGMKLTQILVIIQRVKCHVICLSHPDEFVKQRRPEGKSVANIKEADMIVEWTKMIPKSCSKPHSMTMSKFFTDVAWMTSNPSGTERQLDFRLDPNKISGGHFNEKKSIKDYTFGNLVKQIGGDVPATRASIEPAIVIHPKGTYVPPAAVGKVLTESAKPDAASSAKPAPKGLAALMNKGNS